MLMMFIPGTYFVQKIFYEERPHSVLVGFQTLLGQPRCHLHHLVRPFTPHPS